MHIRVDNGVYLFYILFCLISAMWVSEDSMTAFYCKYTDIELVLLN